MVTDNEVQVFIDGIKHYFNTVSDSKAIVGTPYLINTFEAPSNDYVGIITVSGVRNGSVYFSAARAMLRHLLVSLGEVKVSSELVLDIVGEVTNTISGNVRENFGSQFVISVPIIKEKSSGVLENSQHDKAFTIPFRWKTYTGHLVVCLN
jgi:chemotaxis protein CheX